MVGHVPLLIDLLYIILRGFDIDSAHALRTIAFTPSIPSDLLTSSANYFCLTVSGSKTGVLQVALVRSSKKTISSF